MNQDNSQQQIIDQIESELKKFKEIQQKKKKLLEELKMLEKENFEIIREALKKLGE